MTQTLHNDADDLLHWLNAHSVSVSDGVPVGMLQQKWLATQRTPEQLRASLEWLFQNELVAMTPGLNPPHVRLSLQGFAQLLSAMDHSRLAELVATPTPTPAAMPAAARPAPIPAPAPAPATPTAAIPARFGVETTAPAATRFVSPTKPPTEIGLRNQILAIFRDLKLSAGHQLIAMTLTRYWQEMGLRGEHLRTGIDVMLSDGYLKPTVRRYENYWMLTPDAHAYLSAPLSHPTLLALALPLKEAGERPSDKDLRRLALALFKNSALQPFITLESNWRHRRDALIHALDLLMKSGDVALHESEALSFVLTAQRR